jgi:putative transposase
VQEVHLDDPGFLREIVEQVVSQGVLVVSGVREDGFREILAVDFADTEGEATYQELFRALRRRGLSGWKLTLHEPP